MDALISIAHTIVMSSAMSISLSGMQAAGAMLNVTANNIANLSTPGFNPSRADLVELSGGGVAVSGTSFEDNPQTSPNTQSSNVDLPTELVNLKLGQQRDGAQDRGPNDRHAAEHPRYRPRSRQFMTARQQPSRITIGVLFLIAAADAQRCFPASNRYNQIGSNLRHSEAFAWDQQRKATVRCAIACRACSI